MLKLLKTWFSLDLYMSLQLSWIALLGAKRTYFSLSTPCLQEVSVSKADQDLTKYNVLDAPASNTDGFLYEIQVFLQLSWVGLFGTKWAFIHLENCDLQELFISTINPFLTGKQYARGFSFLHRWFSLEKHLSFFNSGEQAFIDQTESMSIWIHQSCRKCSLQKQT